ncbi:MAG: secretin N-terminal domain-containing protein [Vicinamibacteraceae bacterium]
MSLVAATAVSCAAGAALRKGREAERIGEYDHAVLQYTKAVRARPDDMDARAALQRARLRAATHHFQSGRRFAGAGKLQEALTEYQLAADLNPTASEIDKALSDTRGKLKAKLAVREAGRTELQSLVERARDLSVIAAELPTGIELPDSLVFRDAGSRDIYTAIARFAGINVVFDPAFRNVPLSIDLRNTTLQAALDSLSKSTSHFYRSTGDNTITIIPDTPAKHREYDEDVVRTFYLSNADLKETLDLLRIVIDSRRISTVSATNAITISDTPERIDAAARIIGAIDKARAEVVIDVELVEVDRRRFKEYGLQLASPDSAGPSGAVGISEGDEGVTFEDLRNLSGSDIVFTGLPRLFYRLLKEDGHTRVLANPQLRASDGVPARAVFGEEVPVPTVTFAPIATGGVAQQDITSFEFRQVGVIIEITPRTHHDDDVSLDLKIDVTSLAGTGVADIPIFGNRSIETTIRLRDGETNMLAGLIRDDERTALRGIVGLSDLPIIGRVFAANEKEAEQTDIVLMITPRIVRVLDLVERDLQPFRLRADARSRGGAAVASPAEPPEPEPELQQIPPAEQEPEAEPLEPGQAPGLSPLPGRIPTPTTPGATPEQPQPTKPPRKPRG